MMQANSGGASPPNAKPHQRANWQGFKNQNQQTNYSKSAADCLYELRNVLPDLIDKHNHCWDAIRYALEPAIKAKNYSLENIL